MLSTERHQLCAPVESTATKDVTCNPIPALSIQNAAGRIQKAGLQPLYTMRLVQQRHRWPSLRFYCSKRRFGSDDNSWLTTRPAQVESVAQKDVMRNPVPPFTTSTMQQDSFNRLGFSPSSTMQLAQQLYEGPESAGGTFSGHHGLCTPLQRVPLSAAWSFEMPFTSSTMQQDALQRAWASEPCSLQSRSSRGGTLLQAFLIGDCDLCGASMYTEMSECREVGNT